MVHHRTVVCSKKTVSCTRDHLLSELHTEVHISHSRFCRMTVSINYDACMCADMQMFCTRCDFMCDNIFTAKRRVNQCLFSCSVALPCTLILILHKLGYANRLRSQFLKRMPKWFYLGFIDVAKFKIMWANLQITAAMSWALQIDWPEPFASYVQLLSFMVCLKNPISGLSMCPPQP